MRAHRSVRRRERATPVHLVSGAFWVWAAIALLAVPSPMSSGQASAAQAEAKADASASSTLRLSLDEALAFFFRQNLDLITVRFGIDSARAQQITAGLFPNPVLSIGTLSSFTQGRTINRSGEVASQVQQLFEMAGKRGYRIESAGFGTQSAEANFEDAVRQLSFTVEDTYYRVQLAQRRLALAEENRDRFARILEVNSIRFKKGYIAEVDLIRIRLQIVDFQSQVIQAVQEANAAILDLLDAARTSRLIQQNYIETLFNYQRNVFLLESTVGREITS